MKKLIGALLGEIFFDLDDLTALGWIFLSFALLFGIGVGAVTVIFFFPDLSGAELSRGDKRAYGFFVAAPILIAAVTPLCLGIPILRRLGFNMTKSDTETRNYLKKNKFDSKTEHYIVFEIVRPDASLWDQLHYGLKYNEFSLTKSGLSKIIAYRKIFPTIGRISAARREIRETVKMAETECLSWKISKSSPG